MTQNKKTHTIDFLWSSQKEYSSLKPIFEESKKQGFKSRLLKIHKSTIRNYFKISDLSQNVIISHDAPLKRIKKLGWKGRYIYIEHGLGAMKYYTYKYSFFHEASLLFYPGQVFKRKMKAINPISSGLCFPWVLRGGVESTTPQKIIFMAIFWNF